MLDYEEKTVRRRRPTPRKLPIALDAECETTNATVVEPFRLWYGKVGRRDVEVGARCTLTDVDVELGLCRFTDARTTRALVDLTHFALDENVRPEGYR